MSLPVYTIGYGSRTVDELISLLHRYNVQYLLDIRSQPYSKFKPEYNRESLEQKLRGSATGYLFMGDSLGGRPADSACYVNGKVDYSILRGKAFYLAGIERLRTAVDKGFVVALMCSEGKPQECHRSKLIGKTLSEQGIEILHIDENGSLKTQQDIVQAITSGQQSMFEDVGPASTSRKRY